MFLQQRLFPCNLLRDYLRVIKSKDIFSRCYIEKPCLHFLPRGQKRSPSGRVDAENTKVGNSLTSTSWEAAFYTCWKKSVQPVMYITGQSRNAKLWPKKCFRVRCEMIPRFTLLWGEELPKKFVCFDIFMGYFHINISGYSFITPLQLSQLMCVQSLYTHKLG